MKLMRCRINLFDSNIDLNLNSSEEETFILPNLKFRFTGENLDLNGAKFDSIDFYYLKNGNLLTLNNIKVQSDFLKISPQIYFEGHPHFVFGNQFFGIWKE